MYGRTFIFVNNFHVNLSVVLEIFMCLIFVGQGYPRKLLIFNIEHFPIYGISRVSELYPHLYLYTYYKVSICTIKKFIHNNCYAGNPLCSEFLKMHNQIIWRNPL